MNGQVLSFDFLLAAKKDSKDSASQIQEITGTHEGLQHLHCLGQRMKQVPSISTVKHFKGQIKFLPAQPQLPMASFTQVPSIALIPFIILFSLRKSAWKQLVCSQRTSKNIDSLYNNKQHLSVRPPSINANVITAKKQFFFSS